MRGCKTTLIGAIALGCVARMPWVGVCYGSRTSTLQRIPSRWDYCCLELLGQASSRMIHVLLRINNPRKYGEQER
ncbi:hypothetical protein BKA67DRAFT_578134 [Truncatella angustata]|uniref:Uncharacterized protein n=1 Tax=Truncatella angustata TaxID=152316 RepID=A0A9P8UCM6_9PEZI|nr:uncharacterized protein BKA67DRAFT_578134 [Truncatella angustata]KAH6647644.1 hypothetical protein BKA67DRAFT_578134 [Truncatella angustata]